MTKKKITKSMYMDRLSECFLNQAEGLCGEGGCTLYNSCCKNSKEYKLEYQISELIQTAYNLKYSK